MDPESEEIKPENNIDKYATRPHTLKPMCLADFISLTDVIYSNNKQTQLDDEMSINENTSDDDNCEKNIQNTDTDKLQALFPIKLKNNRILKLRKHWKVIRFVNYKIQNRS